NEFRRIKGKNHLFSFEVSHLYERLNDYRSATRELINKIRLDSLARRPPVLNSVIDRLVLLYKMDKDIIQLVQTAMIDKKVRSRILARLYLVDKRYDRALKEYLFLEDNLLLSEFGEICLKQGLDSLALVCYLRLGNKEEVARLYLKMGNYEQALKALEDSDDLRFQILRVECLIKMRRLDEALKIARSLLEHNTSLRLYLLTEDIYLQKRDFGEAQKVLNNAMKLIDRDSLAYIFFEKANLALFHFKIDEAVAGYNWLVEHFPTNLLANDALERLLVIRKAGGDTAALRMCCSIWYLIKIDSTRQAIDSARKFIKEKRWLAEEGYLMLINIYACRKEYDLGIGAVEEFEVNFPKSERMGRALIIKARILKELGEKDKARETLEYIIMKFGSAPEVLLSREMLNDLRQ
ncbi:MAG: hypothetical protein ABIL05_04415, partial [candidate division WOR-3 bacterium]